MSKSRHRRPKERKDELILTTHGIRRARERLGIPKKAVQSNAEKALRYGVSREEATGQLRRYLQWIFDIYGTANNLRAYNQHIYVFVETRLVTVLCIHNKYREAAEKQQKQKKLRIDMEESNANRRRSK